MTLRTWVRTLFARRPRTIRKALRRRPALRLTLEALEDRTVPSAVWYVNGSAAGSNDGHNWGNAFTDLQSALTAAQPGDQIWVAQGTYKPTSTTDRTISFVLKDDVGVYGGFAGTETALWQRNFVAHPTILSGDIGTPGDKSDNSYHVVTAGFSTPFLSSAAVLDGFTITGGNANGPGLFQSNGAGLFNNHGALTVSNMIFTGNTAASGGGMDNEFSSSALTNVTFAGNTATYAGGGLYNSNSTPTLTNVLFTGNTANGYGGGLENDSSPGVTVINATFSGNSSPNRGGGMFGWSSQVTLTNCIFWGNSARASDNEFGVAGTAPVTTINYSDVQGGASGTGNINADPLFANAAHGDFRLQAGSPAIDAGTNTGAPSFDLAGQPRPLDGSGRGTAITDMGAYEAKASPTFSALLSPRIVYGTATATLSGHLAANLISPPAGELVSVTLNGVTQKAVLDGSGDFSTTFNTAVLGAAGSPYAVTYSYAGDNDFNSAIGGSTLTVNGATPALTVSDAGGTYNGNRYPASATAVGLDGTTPVSGNFTFTYYSGSTASGAPLSDAPSNAGTYTVVANFSSSDPNYSNSSAQTTFTISAATPTVSVSDAGGVYNGNTFPATGMAVGLDGKTPVSGSFTFTYYAGNTASGNPLPGAPSATGTYTVVAAFTSTDSNYTNGNPAQTTFTISTATPTVSVTDAGGTYNGNPYPALGAALGVDGKSAVNGSFSYAYYSGSSGSSASGTPLSGAPINAGTYTVVAAFTSSDPNYSNGTPAQTTFTISAAMPTVSVTDAGGTYNGNPYPASATAVGVDGTTPLSGNFTFTYYAGNRASGTPLAGAPSAAGTYTVVAAFTSSDPNYTNASGQTTFPIGVASTTIAASNVGATFNASQQSLTLTADVSSEAGAVNEGTVTFTVLQGSTVLGTTTSGTVSKGQASVQYVLPGSTAAGRYTLDAVYNPGANFAASSDNTHTLTVAPAASSIQFTSVMVVPNLFGLIQTETFNVHVSGPGGVVNQGAVTFTVDGQSMSASVDGNGNATVSLTLPLLTAASPQSISAAFSGPNRSSAAATQGVYWNMVDLLAPAIATFAADGSQSVQSYLFNMPWLDFLYAPSGQLTEVIFGPNLWSWDFSDFGSLAMAALDGV